MSEVCVAGDTVQLELTVTKDGDPVDLSGMTIRFGLANANGPVANSDDDDISITVTDAAGGTSVVKIHSDLTAILLGTYRYQCEIEDAMHDVATVANGFITFTRDAVPGGS